MAAGETTAVAGGAGKAATAVKGAAAKEIEIEMVREAAGGKAAVLAKGAAAGKGAGGATAKTAMAGKGATIVKTATSGADRLRQHRGRWGSQCRQRLRSGARSGRMGGGCPGWPGRDRRVRLYEEPQVVRQAER